MLGIHRKDLLSRTMLGGLIHIDSCKKVDICYRDPGLIWPCILLGKNDHNLMNMFGEI